MSLFLCKDDDALQETLLNLLLRNYLHYNLYDQAEKLRSKAPRFEAHSNQQVIFFDLDLDLVHLRTNAGVNVAFCGGVVILFLYAAILFLCKSASSVIFPGS